MFSVVFSPGFWLRKRCVSSIVFFHHVGNWGQCLFLAVHAHVLRDPGVERRINLPRTNARENSGQICFGFSCRKNSSNILKFTTEIREALSKFQNLRNTMGQFLGKQKNHQKVWSLAVWPPFFSCTLASSNKKSTSPKFWGATVL